MRGNRNLTRRGFLRASGLTAAGALLAACGATPTPQVVEKVVTQVVEKQVTQVVEKEVTKIVEGTPQIVKETVVVETVVTPTAAITQPTTVTVSFWAYPEQMAEFQLLLDAFVTKQPLIKPEVIPVPVGEYWAKLQTMIAGGSEPNLMYLAAYWFPALASKDLILAIDPLIEASKWDMSMYWEQTLAAFKWNGKQYGLPYVLSPGILAYNKTIFDSAGLKYPPGKLADADWWTWDKLLETATALTKLDSSGRPLQFGCNFSPDYWADIHYWVRANNGKVLSDDLKKCLLDSAESTEGLTWEMELATKHKVNPNVGEATGNIGFPMGTIGMTWFFGSNIPGFRKQITQFEWNIGHLPKGKVRTAPLASECFAPSKRIKQPDAVWQLLSFLCGDEGQMLQAYHPRSMPSTKKAARKFVELSATLPPADLAAYPEALEYARFPDITTKWAEMISLIGKETQKAWLGQQTMPEATAAATKNVNDLLAS